MAGDEKRYLDAGMNAYVSKPIRSVELFLKLTEVTAGLDLGNHSADPAGEEERLPLQTAS
jgi:CheY-like chemotaxis protein